MTVDVDEKLRANAKEGREQPDPEPAPIQKMESMEEWQKLLEEKRKALKKAVDENLPQIWPALELVLSVKSILNIKDITLPLFIILLGAASSLKTVAIQLLRNAVKYVFYTDGFTPKSMVSHSTAVKREELDKIDMLPKIKNKMLLAPEMSPLFAKKDDELIETLGILTRVLDGEGLETDSGAHGHRGHTGEHMFTAIGAAIDIPFKVHKHMAYIGPKIYMLRLSKLQKNEDDYLKQLKQDSFKVKKERIQQALNDYLNVFEMCPLLVLDEKSKLPKLELSPEKDDDETLRIIVKLGILLSSLRSVVTVWSIGDEYVHGTPIKEEPDRAIEQLRNMARGHAVFMGRNHIAKEDLSLPVKVVLSTASIDRVNIFSLLIEKKGTLKTSDIVDSFNMTPPTARYTMTELKAIGLVDIPEPKTETEEMQIILRDNFKWFLSEQFKKLRDGFVPEDNTEEMKAEKEKAKAKAKAELAEKDTRYLKEKCPPTTSESDPKPPEMETCIHCGETMEGYYLRVVHNCGGNRG